MKKSFVVVVAGLAAFALNTASASTASQREYKRGFADCSAGRWDQDQHGVSYKAGCRAAEEKRNAGGAAPTADAPAQPKTDSYVDPSVPGKDKLACVRAVKAQTRNPKVSVISAYGSEANNQVTLGVGPDRAPWKCLVKRGKVGSVMSQTNEGAL